MFAPAVAIDTGSALLWALVLGYAVATILTLLLAGYVARHHWETDIGRTFTVLVGSLSVWILGSLFRLFTTDPGAYVALSTVKFVGVATAPVWFILFALLYAGYGHWVTRRIAVGLLVLPTLEVLVLATTLSHRLFYSEFTPTTLGPVPILQTTAGPGFWFFASFGWMLLLLGSVVFISAAVKRSGLYREQAAVVILAIAISLAANVAYVVWDWPHPALDPTPFGFAVSSLLLAVGVFSTRLIDVVPAARSLVLDAIDDAVVVLDPRGRVVDVNETARDLFDLDRPMGEPVEAVLPPALQEPPADGSATVELVDGGETRHFRHRRIAIGPDGTYGRVVVLTDLTPQVGLQRDLERQNEQLEAFASVVSHDLRNPLNVAQGNLGLAREDQDSDQLKTVSRAHARMEALIEDLLALARQGQSVGDVGPVEVRAVARGAWSSVQSSGAALEVAEEAPVVQGDESRLAQLFENLFRNALEHGGPDVTVHVGALPDGFYVEDDGPGIDAEERGSIFEQGFSTKAEGTGFGLAIARSIVEAHGWAIEAAESPDGGARFEVTGAGDG